MKSDYQTIEIYNSPTCGPVLHLDRDVSKYLYDIFTNRSIKRQLSE